MVLGAPPTSWTRDVLVEDLAVRALVLLPDIQAIVVVVGEVAGLAVRIDEWLFAHVAGIWVLALVDDHVGFEDLVLAACAYDLLENVLAEFATHLLAHSVWPLGLEKESLALLARAVEQIELDGAVFALYKLAEFGFSHKDSFLRQVASWTSQKGPVDFTAVLKAYMGVKSFAGFDGSLGDAFTAGTEDFGMDVAISAGLGHLLEDWV